MKILHNITAHIMDNSYRTESAIAWDNGKITDVGNRNELFEKYPNAEKIDGNGCSVLPGFIDPHLHLLYGLIWEGAFNCTTNHISTHDSLKKKLHEISRDIDKDTWIVAHGYDPAKITNKKDLTRHDLDEACPDHPVIISHWTCHECYANSKAISLAGIDKNTPQPFAGEIKKDSRGELTGHFIENAQSQLVILAGTNMIKQIRGDLFNRIKTFQESLLSNGITIVGDPLVSSGFEDIYQKAYNANIFKLPLVLYPSSDKGMFELPWDKLDHAPTGNGNEQLRIGPLKFFLDGAHRSALRYSPKQYSTMSKKIGIAMLKKTIRQRSLEPLLSAMRIAESSPIKKGKDGNYHGGCLMALNEECLKLSEQAVEKGFALAFHAVGNKAIEQAIDVIDKVRNKHCDYPPPHIVHGIFMDHELIPKIADFGIAIVTQPVMLSQGFGILDNDIISNLPIKPLPLNSLIKAGVRVAGSSDWPCVGYDPLPAIKDAVFRNLNGMIYQENETISVNNALAMYTREAAFVLGCIKEAGTLEPGKRADFILLTGNPLQTGEQEWDNLKVKVTYLGGERVYTKSE